MLIGRTEREMLNAFFQTIKLKNQHNNSNKDQAGKIEQILSYLEILHSKIRVYSQARSLVLIDSCAGNCYLSFLMYYYYTYIEKRNITIHCVDINETLMRNSQDIARKMGFAGMYFHVCDVMEYRTATTVDIVYSLHACDSATDKVIYTGLRHKANWIFSVSCCQHTLRKKMKNPRYRGITKHSVFKDKMVYMVGDSLRALLLEMSGYRADIFQFVSSRYTDKNIMIRAQKGNPRNIEEVREDYAKIREEFKAIPELERYLFEEN